MSVTRSAVLVGIVCSVWMASPRAVNAFDLGEFVGLSDRGTTRVKSCVDGKGGRAFFSNKTALGVELNIDLSGGDGLAGDDAFDAFFDYGSSTTPLFSGVWSKIDERMKKGQVVRETYQLTPGGDLTELSAPGWQDLLNLISAEAGNACLKAPPSQRYGALSDLVKGTLVVEDKEPKCASSEDIRDIACVNACDAGSCMKAKVRLDVKAFMNDPASDIWASVKQDEVRFKYTATGYVVKSAAP
jgi:hypothetical protein